MQLQGRELKFESLGADVKLLQGELVQLGYKIPEREIDEGFFGKGTQRAVSTFQTNYRLEVTGVVDKKTAALINQVVYTLQHKKPFVVMGTVARVEGKPFANGMVHAYDVDLRSRELLGKTKTDDYGRYEIQYSLKQFEQSEKDSADIQIIAYTPDRPDKKEWPSEIVFNADPVETIDLVIGEGKYRGPSEFEQLINEITPLLKDIPIANLDLEEKEHKDVTFLSGETEQGRERITFLITAYRLQGKIKIPAEIFYGFFRQNLPTDLSALLAQSPEVLRHALEAAVNGNIIPLRSKEEIGKIIEFMKQLRVEQALEGPAEEGKPSIAALLETTLEEKDKRRTFLTAYFDNKRPIVEFLEGLRENPELKDHVDDLQFTFQLNTLTKNHMPLVKELQRLRRENKITSLNDLARYDEKEWEEKFVSQEGIGFPLNTQGKDDKERRKKYAKTLSNMVEDTFPTEFMYHRIKEDNIEGKDDLITFFEKNEKFKIDGARLETYLKVNNGSLQGIKDEEGLKRKIKAMQRLYKVAPRYEKISALIKDGVDSAHKIARMGKNEFSRRYNALWGGKGEVEGIHEKAMEIEATGKILWFDFSRGNKPRTNAVPESDLTAVADVIPDWRMLFGSLDMCDCGHCRSVYSPAAYLVDILHFLKDRKLVEVTRNENGDITETKYKKITLPGGTEGDAVKHVLFMRRPDLGEIELTCENTNTPLPYVDLVNEIMENFIAPYNNFSPFILHTTENDLNDRKLRRALYAAFEPDLGNHPVVTVKKRGEWWTIDDTHFTYTVRKDGNQIRVTQRSRQTTASAEVLAANPQYMNTVAYDKLRKQQQVFPWQLPFNLWMEEVRSYLAHLGVQRYEIMGTFLRGDRKTLLEHIDIVHEYLGLTLPEAKIIDGTVLTDPGTTIYRYHLWGFSSQRLDANPPIPDPAGSAKWITTGSWIEVLRGRVDVVLQQSGLKYRELLDLLVTTYVNPIRGNERKISVQSTDEEQQDTCDLAMLKLEGLEEGDAEKMCRFVRLWRKLGWSMWDIDRAITAFNKNDLHEDFLKKLSHVKRLHVQLRLSIDKILCFWADIDTVEYIDHHASGQPKVPSLYMRLFRNKAITNPLDPGFTDDPASLNRNITSHIPAITAAFGISDDDFTLLFNDENTGPRVPNPANPAEMVIDDTLNLKNLSQLFRHATLARALKLPVREYLSAIRLMGTGPFTSTVDTVLFVEKIEKMKKSGFTITELDYLLRHEFIATSGVTPTEEEIALILDELRQGLQKIASENTFITDKTGPNGPTTDRDGTLTRERLAQLNWDSATIEWVMSVLNGTAIFEAELTTDPQIKYFSPRIKDELEGRLTYDNNKLRFTGVMTSDLANRLTSIPMVSNDFKNAVKVIWEARRRYMRTFSVPTFSHRLGVLPPGIIFPALFNGRVYYDDTQNPKQLYFIGVMTEAERDILFNLAPDRDYRNAITALFDAPRTFVPQLEDTFLTIRGPNNDIDTLFAKQTTLEGRYKFVLEKLMNYLRNSLSKGFIKQRLSEALALELEVADALLEKWVDYDPARSANPPSQDLSSDFSVRNLQ